MNSKAPLALMEELVMLAVFALAAALCLQAFVKSDEISQRGEARDQAVIVAQSVAEAVRHSGGDLETAVETAAGVQPVIQDGRCTVEYDEEWSAQGSGSMDRQPTEYQLVVWPVESGVSGMGKAGIRVAAGGDTLFELETAWQEVDG